MKSIFAAIFSAALFIAGCLDNREAHEVQDAGTSAVAQPLAGSVTVQVPTESWQGQYDAVNVPAPPPWGFYGYSDNFTAAFFPVLTVPVGGTITQVAAKIKGSAFNTCMLSLWRMTDFEHSPQLIVRFPNVSQTATTTVTSIATNAPVISLTKLYLEMRTSPVDQCQVMSIEATYTPPL